MVLRKITKVLLSDNYDFISFRNIIIHKKGENTKHTEHNLDNKDIKLHMLKSPLNYPGYTPYTFRRSTFIDSGAFDEEARWGDAMFFWRKFFQDHIKIEIIDDIGYVYDQSDETSVGRDKSTKQSLIAYKVILKTYITNKKEIKPIGYDKVWELILLIKAIGSRSYPLIGRSFLRFIWGNPIKVISSVFYIFKTKIIK